MAAQLSIDDGTPAWWESPDIWVVPGADPLGSPGSPVVGQAAYLWARVHNRGDVDVAGARVGFWWANPAAGVARSLATQVGSAFVDVAAGAVEDVLCLVPWVPVFVNGGHECLVCEVVSTQDPLPTPLPDAFDAPVHRQVAQRNLSVVPAAQAMMLAVQLIPAGGDRATFARVEVGGELDKAALAALGLRRLRPAEDALVRASLSTEGTCDTEGTEELKLSPDAVGLYLHLRPAAKAKAGTYTVVRVTHGDERPAGVTFVAIGGEDHG